MGQENLLSNGSIQPSPVSPGSFIPWRVGHGACGCGCEMDRGSLDGEKPWRCLHWAKASEGRTATRGTEREQKDEMCLPALARRGLLQTGADGRPSKGCSLTFSKHTVMISNRKVALPAQVWPPAWDTGHKHVEDASQFTEPHGEGWETGREAGTSTPRS